LLLTLWCKIEADLSSKPTSIFTWGGGERHSGIYAGPKGIIFACYRGAKGLFLRSQRPPLFGVWTHVAVLFDGKTAALFLNGQPDNSMAFDGTIPYYGEQATVGGQPLVPFSNATVGFKGAIARIELTENFDPAAPFESLLAAKIDADLGPVAVGASGPIPLEFAIRNSDDEPALLLEDKDQSLTIELRNTSAHTISLPDPKAVHAIELRFRPGTLHDPKNIKTGPPEKTSPGGAWTVAYVAEPDATDTLLLHTAAAAELKPGETVRIPLLGLRPDRANGARTTRIQLRYHLSYGDRYPLEGSRVHALSLLYPLSTGAEGELVELSAAIVGDDAVFCDGTTRNNLTIRVFNLSPFPLEISATSQLRLYIDCVNDGNGAPPEHSNRPTALFRTEDEGSINKGLTVSTTGWGVGAALPFALVIEAKFAKRLGESGAADSFVEFKLDAFTCHGLPGAGELRIEFLNIGKKNRHGERPTGIVSVPVRRVNVLATAAGQTIAKGDLTLSNFNKIDLKKADADVPVTISVNAPRTVTIAADQVQLATQKLHVATGQPGEVTIDGNGISYASKPGQKDTPGYLVPRGAIIMWSGAADKIPEGWALCDGNEHNGVRTPNLINRFVMGVSPDRSGNTGGEAEVELRREHIPSHSHRYGDIFFSEAGGTIDVSNGFGQGAKSDYDNKGLEISRTTDPWGGNTWGQTIAHNNMPPWYGLAFLMKL
jgi:microcystin-dependent protein